jgi:4'-phosphopantetheinyl transferase EntD
MADPNVRHGPMKIPTTNLDLAHSIEALAIPGVLIGHRIIAEGDELALWPGEAETFANSVDKVKRASGAARFVARQLMRQLGHAEQTVPKSATGAPIWPRGLVGSLAHDSQVAVAAMARSNQFQSLGIDVEPAEPLEAELLSLIATTSEVIRIAEDPYRGRLLFAVKEAVYKTLNPLDGQFLDHHDVEVNLASGQAITRTGHAVQFRYGLSSHIVVLAFK